MFTRTVRPCSTLISAARAMTRMRPSSISFKPIGMVDQAASIWPVMPAVKLGVDLLLRQERKEGCVARRAAHRIAHGLVFEVRDGLDRGRCGHEPVDVRL